MLELLMIMQLSEVFKVYACKIINILNFLKYSIEATYDAHLVLTNNLLDVSKLLKALIVYNLNKAT